MHAVKVANYYSISLYNVIYKLVSTVIIVPGRQIFDYVFIAYELMYFLKRKNSGKHGYMSIKLDMDKSYDRVE